MGLKKDILDKLTNIERLLIEINRKVSTTPGEVKRLEDQNKQLLNRLMAVNFEKYATYAPENIGDSKPTEVVVSPITDENNAGEILSDEELGK